MTEAARDFEVPDTGLVSVPSHWRPEIRTDGEPTRDALDILELAIDQNVTGEITAEEIREFAEMAIIPAIRRRTITRDAAEGITRTAEELRGYLAPQLRPIRLLLRGLSTSDVAIQTHVARSDVEQNVSETLQILQMGDEPATADLNAQFHDMRARKQSQPTEKAALAGAAPAESEWDLDDESPPRKTSELAGGDSIGMYFRQIGKVALLNAEQEVDLSKRIEAGLYAAEKLRAFAESGEKIPAQLRQDLKWIVREGEDARRHLIEANLRLVVSLAKRYTGQGMAFLDLIQEGNLGLIRGVEKFDYTKGFKFSTYATWWIRQAITRAMADQGRTIRVPVHKVEEINKMNRIWRELTQDLGRDPTVDEVAKELDITPDKVVELHQYDQAPLSLDQTIGDEGDAPLGNFVQDSEAPVAVDAVAFELLQGQLGTVLDTLTEREAQVLRLRYGLVDGQPRTLIEIGVLFGVTRERIRQIENAAMEKLRNPSRLEILRGYLE